jgi:ketosteroid isomerase-like protein
MRVGEDNLRIVREALDAFGARDVVAIQRLVDPEVEFFPMTRLLVNQRDPYRGHDGIRRYLTDVSKVWDALEVTPRHYDCGADHVVVRGRIRGKTVDGTDIDLPADWIWKLREGKIVWGCVYAKRDAALALQAAGISSR